MHVKLHSKCQPQVSICHLRVGRRRMSAWDNLLSTGETHTRNQKLESIDLVLLQLRKPAQGWDGDAKIKLENTKLRRFYTSFWRPWLWPMYLPSTEVLGFTSVLLRSHLLFRILEWLALVRWASDARIKGFQWYCYDKGPSIKVSIKCELV